jgi:hypothetical protein
VDEEAIDNMSYLFFEDVIEELGHKLVYDAVVNYAGNSFCDKSWDMITDRNPFNIGEEGQSSSSVQNSLLGFLEGASVKVQKRSKE